jgi:hypothetical protein
MDLDDATTLIRVLRAEVGIARGEIDAFRSWLDGLKKNPSTPTDERMSASFHLLALLADRTDEARAATNAAMKGAGNG